AHTFEIQIVSLKGATEMILSAFQFLLFGTLCAIVTSDIKVILDNSKVLVKRTFSNKLYYISKTSIAGFTQAKEWCAANGGGYPAEIDTLEEFAFLESIIEPNGYLRVYISGTDAQKDGTWVSQRTGVQLNVFDWLPGEPNNFAGPEDCLELVTYLDGKLNDIACYAPE
ncbi:mannose-binding protein C, partial [Biomphalaria glabrata]